MSDRLRTTDRAADARARLYGRELEALCDVADRCANGVVPTGALRELAERMTGDPGPEPASLDAFRERRLTVQEFDRLVREPR